MQCRISLVNTICRKNIEKFNQNQTVTPFLPLYQRITYVESISYNSSSYILSTSLNALKLLRIRIGSWEECKLPAGHDLIIDHSLIILFRPFVNIYHYMESINSLLHYDQLHSYLPKVVILKLE